jgi:hypothetical protein
MTSQFGGGYLFYQDFGPRRPMDGFSMKSNITVTNDPFVRVPTPSLYVPFCPDYITCYQEVHLADKYQISTQKDASKIVES